MDWKRYITLFAATTCISVLILFVVGMVIGVSFNYISAGICFGIGFVGFEMFADLFFKRGR